MRSAGSGVAVSWQSGHTGSEGSTVVRGWIGTCSVAKELETSGADDMCQYADGSPHYTWSD